MLQSVALLVLGSILSVQGAGRGSDQDAPPSNGGQTPRAARAPRPPRAAQELPLNELAREAIKSAASVIDAYNEARREHVDSGHDRGTFSFDMSAGLETIREIQNNGGDAELAQALLVAEGSLRHRGGEALPPEFLDALRNRVPSSFPGWYLEPRLLERVAESAGDEQAMLAYVEGGAFGNPMPRVRRRLLSKMASIAFQLGDAQKGRSAFNALERDFFGTVDFIETSKKWDSFVKTFPGRMAPGLKAPSLNRPGHEIDLDALAGKHVLVVFWDAGSRECAKELPYLKGAWETFKDSGLEMICLALGERDEDRAAFKAQAEGSMPWQAAAATESIASDWGIASVPRPILVGPDGKIICVGSALLGGRLSETLREHIGKQS